MDDQRSYKTKRAGKKINKGTKPPKVKNKKDVQKKKLKHSP